MPPEVRAHANTGAMHNVRGTTATTSRGITGACGKMKAAVAIGACRAVSGRPRICINGRMRSSAGTDAVMASVVSKRDQGQRREFGT